MALQRLTLCTKNNARNTKTSKTHSSEAPSGRRQTQKQKIECTKMYMHH